MSNIRAWTRGLRLQLLVMIVFPVLSMAGIILYSIHTAHEIHENADLVARDRLPKMVTLLKMRINAEGAVRFLWAAVGFEDMTIRNEKITNSLKKFSDYNGEYVNFMALKPSEQVRASLEAMAGEWKTVEGYAHEVFDLLKKGDPTIDRSAKKIIEGNLIPLYLKQLKVMGEIEKTIKAQVDGKISENDENAKSSAEILLWTGLIVGLITFLVGTLIAYRLASKLGNVSAQVGEAGSQVKAASEQLSAASQSLSTVVAQSAGSMEETVASLEELSGTTKLNAENANQAATLAQQTSKSAEEGAGQIRELIQSMKEIAKSSGQIEEIINVIDDIAFQTNLLALNAAVEAARAGDQGKGFAVVAEAVRNLAQKSSSAAKDINTLIRSAVDKTAVGTDLADRGGVKLAEIVQLVQKSSDLVAEISVANNEQANAISQISAAMNNLDKSTQGNAASSEEVAASGEELSAQSALLESMVITLNEIVHGGSPREDMRGAYAEDSEAKSPDKKTTLRMILGGKKESHHHGGVIKNLKVSGF